MTDSKNPSPPSTPQDPRSKNTWFDTTSVQTYLDGYRQALFDAIGSVNSEALARACQKIEETSAAGRSILVIGNGGSAAIADHLCCDWTKGTFTHNHPPIRTQSLAANSALLTAAANDFGFEASFSKQVQFLGQKGDLLVAISSSGNSPNILNAVREAKSIGMQTIGLSGFSGGKLNDEADISLFVAINNYGIVEDAHQSLMHILAQYIVRRRETDPR